MPAILLMTILAAAQLAPLAPLTAWRVSYDDGMCILSRPFGTAAAPFTLAFRRTPLNYEKSFLVMLMTPPDKKGPLFWADASLTLAPSGVSSSGKASSAVLADGSARLSLFSIEGDAVDGIGEATAVTVSVQGLPTVSFAPTATSAALRALDQCGRDVAVRWGVPAAELAALGTPPTPRNVSAVFGVDAYPKEAIQHGEQGRVIALLSLDAMGRVVDCAVKSPSGYRALDNASCAIAPRLRYTPALDKQGVPMASHTGLPVRWVLPGRRPKKQ